VVDAQLGRLERRRRWWRGRITLGDHPDVPLAVPGGRSGPDPDALTMAQGITPSYAAWQPALVEMLTEHRPEVGSAEPVVIPPPVYAAVITLDGELAVELGYRVEWDEEHTLGARFRGDEPVELCGSVLEP
jgi:hypothetical protein